MRVDDNLAPQNGRSKKIVVVAHCILNQNSRVQGLAKFKGTITPIVEILTKSGVGIIQMPCPEFLYMGYKRWAQTKEQYDITPYRRLCRKIAKQIGSQIHEYAKNGVEIAAILGIEGSPTCAVTKTTKGYTGGDPTKIQNQKGEKIREKGILIEELEKILTKMKIKTRLIGINNRAPEKATAEIREILQQAKW